jgi:hypothetical protein
MRTSVIVVPHLGHGGRGIACVEGADSWNEGMVLSICRREHAPLSVTNARGVVLGR